jgi:hypothetical protein
MSWWAYVGFSLIYWFAVMQLLGLFVISSHCHVAASDEKEACDRAVNIANLLAFTLGMFGNVALVWFLSSLKSPARLDAPDEH